jgi:hypothetical protein
MDSNEVDKTGNSNESNLGLCMTTDKGSISSCYASY